MLNDNSQRTLSQLFMRIIEGENKIEILRKCLCENYDFSPKVLFRSLCKVYSDSMLPKDLKDFMLGNGEVSQDQEAYLLVRQYSSLQNGRLSEEDFSHLVLSATNDSLPYLVGQRFHVQSLSVGVKYGFLSLLKEELKLHRETEALKVQLFQDPDFSLWKAFEMLNSGNKGYLSESDITSFLQKRGRFISQNDYDSLMRRIDLEDDLVLSYNEFLEALLPLQVPKKFPSSHQSVSNPYKTEESWKKSGIESANFGKSEKKQIKKEVSEDRPFKAEDLEVSKGIEEGSEKAIRVADHDDDKSGDEKLDEVEKNEIEDDLEDNEFEGKMDELKTNEFEESENRGFGDSGRQRSEEEEQERKELAMEDFKFEDRDEKEIRDERVLEEEEQLEGEEQFDEQFEEEEDQFEEEENEYKGEDENKVSAEEEEEENLSQDDS